jgi:hypothetical protein
METHVERYKRLLKIREDYLSKGEGRIAILLPQLRQAQIEYARLDEDRYKNPILLKKSREKILELDRELKHEQSLLDYHASEITNLLDKIKEIEITDPNTLQSAHLVRMASRNPLQNKSVKNVKSTIHPLQRLQAHALFYRKFMNRIEGNAGVPGALHRKGVTLKEHYPIGGRRKTLKRKPISTTCPKPTRYMVV